MEKRLFKTVWKRDQKFGDDDFHIGKIIGIAVGMDIFNSKNGRPFPIGVNDDVRCMIVCCTDEEYEKFKELVEKHVFFKCDFDTK